MGKMMRESILKEQRRKCRQRVNEHRRRKMASGFAKFASNIQSTETDDKYNTPSAESKALAKIIRAFPSAPGKQRILLGKLFHSLDESVQLEIVLQNTSIRRPANAISQDLVMKVRSFYERDDISRVSPNAKDVRYFTDQSGKKELQQIRHLLYRLSEVYALFIMEYGEGENGENGRIDVPLKISKFCNLRPVHVKLVNTMPRNVCYCLYHTNFIECCKSLHRIIPEFPLYDSDSIEFLICENSTVDCWTRKCVICTATAIKGKVEELFKTSIGSPTPTVSWLMWKQDENIKRCVKTTVKGSSNDLIEYLGNIVDKFIVHVHVKRAQAKSFEEDRKEMEQTARKFVAMVQMDYAENYSCASQDEVQSAHWNQKLVSDL